MELVCGVLWVVVVNWLSFVGSQLWFLLGEETSIAHRAASRANQNFWGEREGKKALGEGSHANLNDTASYRTLGILKNVLFFWGCPHFFKKLCV